MKLTKQGVRDLNSIGPRPAKKRESFPPEQFMCQHGSWTMLEHGMFERCDNCGLVVDVEWD